MHRYTLLLLFTLSFKLIIGYSQETTPVKGSITGLDETILAGAHVINMDLRLGTTTNDSGCFEIIAKPGDSIFISHIGYSPRLIIMDDSPNVSDFHIYLVPLSTELKGITVYALPENFLDFKRLFSNLKLPADSSLTVHIPPLGLAGSLPTGG
ncbi:MAG: hypothetical protein CVU06_14665, partial [Bacteroidetes bacterium HGW-Bacteroidetes-22]